MNLSTQFLGDDRLDAIILWRCGHITMKLGTHVHHDVKCKLWKNKMAVTYISRLDELGNCWRFASDLPLCWSYSSMKMCPDWLLFLRTRSHQSILIENLETRKCVSTTLMSRSALFGQNHNLAWRFRILYHDVHVYQVSRWFDHIFIEL
jgi:hypothetical protein